MDIRIEQKEIGRDGYNNNNKTNSDNNNNNNKHNGNTPVSCTRKTLDRSGSETKPVRYRECLKNHGASVGRSIYDGCGEFMPSGEEGSIDALKCAVCDCHRNFHLKEPNNGSSHHQYGGGSTGRQQRHEVVNMMHNPLQLLRPTFPSYQRYVTPMSVAYGGGSGGVSGGSFGGAESSSEDLNLYGQSGGNYGRAVVGQPQPPFSMYKKRFRTKFTAEQKERMMEFAEKLGWRMNKQEEEELERFCSEIGVKRQIFKVWMHNNKNNAKKQTAV